MAVSEITYFSTL